MMCFHMPFIHEHDEVVAFRLLLELARTEFLVMHPLEPRCFAPDDSSPFHCCAYFLPAHLDRDIVSSFC